MADLDDALVVAAIEELARWWGVSFEEAVLRIAEQARERAQA